MKLRTRLFLWVGIIFVLAFAFSLFFETMTTNKSLKKAEEELRAQILKVNEAKRQHLEEYLHVALVEDQAEIDSLLLRMSRDPNFGATLFIDHPDLNLVAPAHSSFLIKNEKWVDFLQTTKNDQLTSLIIPINFPMQTTHIAPIEEDFSWIILNKDKKLEKPYMGVKLPLKAHDKQDLSFMIDSLIETDWGLTVLFDPEALVNFQDETFKNVLKEQTINLKKFQSSILKAAAYLRENKGEKGWIQKDIRSKHKKALFSETPFDRGVHCLQQEGEILNARIVELMQNGDQAIMLSVLASIFPEEAFGKTPFTRMAPKGIARFPYGESTGYSLLTDEVFFQKKFFNDSAYFKKHPSGKKCEGMGGSIAVIAPKSLDRVFIGNSLKLEGKTGSGYLTVGVDASQLVQDFVLAVNQDSFLVHNNTVISAFCRDGRAVKTNAMPFNPKMLTKKNGIVNWKGINYYYLHMVPFKNLDLHFYMIQPEEKAFSLLRSVEKGSREVIKSVSFNMRLIAVLALAFVLILLHKIANRIAKPITALANVTGKVVKGQLEDIELPKVPKSRNDEIAILCNSFDQMVSGLKEKEKVKGVLNKVVSQEIAEEITKGTIHLGGEERKVTVLFADIRNFTHMTANMDPKDVIELLNTCMTKISHIIDEYGGVIDKYVGDEVMALFDVPIQKPDSALKSIQCALKIVEELANWNKEREKENKPPVQMGVGIHTGVVLVGNMGAENRLNYTVLGKNVNLASRLCSAAKPMEILITKDTLEETHVKENIEVEELPPKELKGFDESIILYRIIIQLETVT